MVVILHQQKIYLSNMQKIYVDSRCEDLLNSVRENKGIQVIMCECAFGDTPEELQLMGKRIKEIVNTGGEVIIIK